MSGGMPTAVSGWPACLRTQANGQAPGGDRLAVLRYVRRVADGLFSDLDDADVHLEYVLEPERPAKVERCGDAGKADARSGRRDAEAGGAPQRMLGLFHVAVEPGKMHDSRAVGLVELHPPLQAVAGRHECILGQAGSCRWQSRRTGVSEEVARGV